ncbi:MAG: hypothetical protein U0457_10385 [Candidatus Sericytochromatia bacterium]
MKKSLFILSSLMLFSCSTNNLESPIIQENTEILEAKPTEESLIKKLVTKRFDFADKNKDKILVFSEFKGLESENEDTMMKLFKEYDKNKDSKLTYEEFFSTDSEGIKSTLSSMFNMLDSNKNSFIDGNNDELDMLIELAFSSLTDSGVKTDLLSVKKYFLSYDDNKDGSLNQKEYLIPELHYILIADVNPYKNSVKSLNKPLSLKSFLEKIKNNIKKV